MVAGKGSTGSFLRLDLAITLNHEFVCRIDNHRRLAYAKPSPPVFEEIDSHRTDHLRSIYFRRHRPFASSYDQPVAAFLIHVPAKVCRICGSHSGCPFAPAIARYRALRSLFSASTNCFRRLRSVNEAAVKSLTETNASRLYPMAPAS